MTRRGFAFALALVGLGLVAGPASAQVVKPFKITGSGKVMSAQAGKRHGMIKRTTKQIREHRGMNVRFKTDGEKIKKYWMPNG